MPYKDYCENCEKKETCTISCPDKIAFVTSEADKQLNEIFKRSRRQYENN